MADPARRRHRVLLVDDDPDVLRVLTRGLEARGFEVLGASSVEDALELFAEQGADAVVSDLVMAGRAGLGLLREVRRTAPGTPTVAISGGGAIEASFYLEAADATGADGVLQKPFEPGELACILEELLEEESDGPPGVAP